MKKMHKMMLRAGLAAMALGMAGSASAAQYLMTYQGTVGNDRDSTRPAIDEVGLFGAPNSILTGAAFTAVFTLDDSVPGQNIIIDQYGHYRSGTISPSNPFLSALITIGGNNFLFAENSRLTGVAGRNFLGSNSGLTSQIYSNTTGSGIVFNVNSPTGNFLSSLNLGDPYSYNVRPGDSFGGLFQYAVPGVGSRNNGYRYTIAELNITSISGGPVQITTGAVPEPATWAMMIFGFGLVGGGMRKTNGRNTNKRRHAAVGKAHTV